MKSGSAVTTRADLSRYDPGNASASIPPPPWHWINNLQDAAAIDLAARLGLFDGKITAAPPLLRVLLQGAGLTDDKGQITAAFARDWTRAHADILAVAQFYRRVAADIATGFDELVQDLPRFMDRAATFRLFCYDKALHTDPQSLAATAQWVAYLEALSRYEAPILAPLLPFTAGERVLEVGGNTGVMAAALPAQICVADLPAVCALGRVRRPEITFAPFDLRAPNALMRFTGRMDAVLFKSVLHDWPETQARDLLAQAVALVPEGGRVVICERGAFDAHTAARRGMDVLANLVFAPFYRAENLYENRLADLGCNTERRRVDIDMPFHITIGTKPGTTL